eukprot:1967905-Amphidinium_carterae.1
MLNQPSYDAIGSCYADALHAVVLIGACLLKDLGPKNCTTATAPKVPRNKKTNEQKSHKTPRKCTTFELSILFLLC